MIGRTRRPSQEVIENIYKMRKIGISIEKIAQLLHTTPHYVELYSQWVPLYGTKLRRYRIVHRNKQ